VIEGKLKLGRLKELIKKIYLTAFDDTAEVHVVFAAHPN